MSSMVPAEIAHELRTPLHGVLAAASLLLDSRLDAEQREHVATIREAAHALLHLANGALGAAPDDSTCDPRDVADGVRRLLAPTAHAKGIALALHVDDDAPRGVRADAGWLRQVLVNLVGNAVKFTAHGGVTLRLARGATADGAPALHCEVADTGPGLDGAARATLFQPFARSDAPGTTDQRGAGLGLAISASLVRRMGGEIGVRGAAGAGCTFWIALPCSSNALSAEDAEGSLTRTSAPSAPSAFKAVPQSERVAGQCTRNCTSCAKNAAPDAQPLRRATTVLVVDDDAVGRRMTARMLERLGARVDTAHSVASADAALRAARYDLVLLDRHLPDGDGVSVARALRDAERVAARRTHVVALTGCAEPATRAHCLAAGMDDVLVKPVSSERLAELLGTGRAAHAPPAAVVDESRLAELCELAADVPGLLEQVAADYAAGAARQLATLEQALAAGDDDAAARAARAAHTLRGSSVSAGATRAAALAGAVERALAAGMRPDVGVLRALRAAAEDAASALARAAAR